MQVSQTYLWGTVVLTYLLGALSVVVALGVGVKLGKLLNEREKQRALGGLPSRRQDDRLQVYIGAFGVSVGTAGLFILWQNATAVGACIFLLAAGASLIYTATKTLPPPKASEIEPSQEPGSTPTRYIDPLGHEVRPFRGSYYCTSCKHGYHGYPESSVRVTTQGGLPSA